MTPDLAESPIVSGWEFLCTTTMEYNPYVSKENTTLCHIYHQNSYDFFNLHMCLLTDSKCVSKILLFKKSVCVKNPLEVDLTVAETRGLEIAL